MANLLKDLSDGDINRFALVEFHNALVFLKTINNQYDNRFGTPGAKNDGQILIRNPNEFKSTLGRTLDVQDANESTQTMVVAIQRHIGLPAFSSVEMTMQVDEFRTLWLRPAMKQLAQDVEFDIVSERFKDVFNQTGDPALTPDSLRAVRDAQARLTLELAPHSERSILLESTSLAATLDSMNTFFHKDTQINKSFEDGKLGHAAGFDWRESTMTPTHINGTRTDTTPVVNTATGITSGTPTITTTGGSAGTMTKGDIFTVEGVFSINRRTKARQQHLQQFVVTVAVADASGTEVINVSPTPVSDPTDAKQNIEIDSPGAGKAVTNLTGGGSGAAGATYPVNLAYHKDAFTFATTDLHIEPKERMSREVMDGISMRLWQGTDIVNDTFLTRFDILYGSLTQRPEWATRVMK